jgi:hypothetical protein
MYCIPCAPTNDNDKVKSEEMPTKEKKHVKFSDDVAIKKTSHTISDSDNGGLKVRGNFSSFPNYGDYSAFDEIEKMLQSKKPRKKHEQKTYPTPHLINIQLIANNINMSAKDKILTKFNYETIPTMYDKLDDQGVPIVYPFIHKYIKQLKNDVPIVTFSPDQAISACTVSGMAEKEGIMYIDTVNGEPMWKSHLKVIYFTSRAHVEDTGATIDITACTNSIMANLLCLTEVNFTHQKLVLDAAQFILIGLNDDLLSDYDTEILGNLGITYFTLKMMKKKGINNVLSCIKNTCVNDPVHVIFDMAVMDKFIAPCVTRHITKEQYDKLDGMTLEQIDSIFDEIQNLNVRSIDVTGYDLRFMDKDAAHRVTCETARRPLTKILNFKQKSINIFNENTKFLIWRPMGQASEEDIGWFILRGMSLDIREELIQAISDDEIKTIQVTDDDGEEVYAYVAITTMAEQEQKSFLTAESVTECALFYEEKVNMMFELINTKENSILTENATA